MDVHGLRALIQQAQKQNAAAQEQLFQRLRPFLEQIARRYADPARVEESTSDLVQEFRLRIWQRLERFQVAADDAQTLVLFRAWIRKLARRRALNWVRDGQADKRRPPQPIVPLDPPAKDGHDPADGQPSPSAIVRHAEENRLVLDALAGLPDEIERTIVRLRFFEELSLRQIAEQLALTYDQTRTRFQNALRRLGNVLGKHP